MMMGRAMTTFTDIAPTIAKLLRLLASDKPGEVAASAHALRRVLGSAKLDLHDLANVVEFSARREISRVEATADDPDDLREMIRCRRECSGLLTSKELAFVRSMARWRGEPTERQLAWLGALYERCMKGEHA
jgi:hypothetical protein